MTDSTIDDNAGDALEVGPSAEELFGSLEESRNDPPDEAVDPHPPKAELSTIESRVDEIAGRTADDIVEQFEQVRSEAGGECDVDSVLADESPEEIIACADEDEDDTDVLGDEDGLEDLLLTERQAGSEFLWVETGDEESESDDEPAKASADAAAPRPADDAESEEPNPETDLETVPFGSTGSKASPSDDGMASELEDDRAERPDPEAGEDTGEVSGEEPRPDVEGDGQPDDSDDASAEPAGEKDDVDASEDSSSGLFGWLRRKLGSIF